MVLIELISLFEILLVLILAERLVRHKNIQTQYSRPLIHIVVAVLIGIWPYYMSYRSIEYIALAFLVVVFLSRELKIFKSIHEVNRKTVGELLFPISIGLVALLSPE